MLIDQIRRLENQFRKPQGEPKTDDEWIHLVRGIDRAFNGGFCHNYKRPHYSSEEREQILGLRSQIEKKLIDFEGQES